MGFWNSFASFFEKFGPGVAMAVEAASVRGFKGGFVKLAVPLIKQADAQFADSAQKREWVVQQLAAQGIPESLARLAVELGYQLYKREVEDPINKIV